MEDEADDPLPEKPLDEAMTTSEYHQLAQKQIMNALFAALAEAKMEWPTVAPFLDYAREVCAGDLKENGRIRLHVTRAEGDDWVEAEEAFLEISAADRDDGLEWLSETWWLSDIATEGSSRQEVEAIIAGLERTIAKLRTWLDDGGGIVTTEPPPEPDQA